MALSGMGVGEGVDRGTCVDMSLPLYSQKYRVWAKSSNELFGMKAISEVLRCHSLNTAIRS